MSVSQEERIRLSLEAARAFQEKLPGAKFYPAIYKPDTKQHVGVATFDKCLTSDLKKLEGLLIRYRDSYLCAPAKENGVVIVDIDDKPGETEKGSDSLLDLELEHGLVLPETARSKTPSGTGEHLLYLGEVKAKAHSIAHRVDTAFMTPLPGVYAPGKGYYGPLNGTPFAPIPQWVIDRVGRPLERDAGVDNPACELDHPANTALARDYLINHAPEAIEGQGGDNTAVDVALAVRDLGITEAMCLDLMLEHYESKCHPFDAAWLTQKVEHAYQYAKRQIGAESPLAEFEPIDPGAQPADGMETAEERVIREFNRDYAVVLHESKVRILIKHDRTDSSEVLKAMTKADFELLESPRGAIATGVKANGDPKYTPKTKLWLDHPRRHTVRGVVFRPGKDVPCDIYNMWQGFAVTPYAGADYAEKCRLYRRHVEDIICRNEPEIIRYLWAWCADMIQNPGGRIPGVAVAVTGKKGTGKGTFVQPLLNIMGKRHGVQITDKERVLGRFNGIVGAKILCFLDEAFWAGNKGMEGTLKGLITESQMTFERKFMDPCTIDSYVRVIIASNEDFFVPATDGERRYLVLEASDKYAGKAPGKKAYFDAINAEMDGEGTAALMRWLLEYDTTGVNLRDAPDTDELVRQKLQGSGSVHSWVYERLQEDGFTPDEDFGQAVEGFVPTAHLHGDYLSWCRLNGEKYPKKSAQFIRTLLDIFPTWERYRPRTGEKRPCGYLVRDLDACRKMFLEKMGAKSLFDDEDDLWLRSG